MRVVVGYGTQMSTNGRAGLEVHGHALIKVIQGHRVSASWSAEMYLLAMDFRLV